MAADADHLDGVVRPGTGHVLAHQRHHLGGADVEADDERLVTLAIHDASCGCAGRSAQRSAKPLV